MGTGTHTQGLKHSPNIVQVRLEVPMLLLVLGEAAQLKPRSAELNAVMEAAIRTTLLVPGPRGGGRV